MHLLPDAAEDEEDLEIENYPTAYLFATIGFFLVFFVQKVLTPLLVPTEGDFSSQQGSKCCSTGATAILGNVSGTSPYTEAFNPDLCFSFSLDLCLSKSAQRFPCIYPCLLKAKAAHSRVGGPVPQGAQSQAM